MKKDALMQKMVDFRAPSGVLWFDMNNFSKGGLIV